MSVRVDLQGISAGYFIDRRGALGLMTGQVHTVGIPNGRVFSRMRRVFA
jgi:hypothetical protein